jgi:cyclic beta-1,2-glucan synthetase
VRVRGPAGTLCISIEDPDAVGAGRVELEVDGKPHTDDVLPLPTDGRDHAVVARLHAFE